MESTRIIPISGARTTQPANIIRMEPDPGLIKLERQNGRESLSGGDPESAQRFAGEVNYVSYYAARLAETLGMRRLQVAILEDREGQAVMCAEQQDDNWHGTISSSRRSIKQVLESLGR